MVRHRFRKPARSNALGGSSPPPSATLESFIATRRVILERWVSG